MKTFICKLLLTICAFSGAALLWANFIAENATLTVIFTLTAMLSGWAAQSDKLNEKTEEEAQ